MLTSFKFDDVTVLTDGVGEWASTTVAVGENNLEIKKNKVSALLGLL